MAKLTGNEKSFLGGLLAFLSASIVQLQAQGGGYTWKEFAWAVGAWLVVHLGVFLTTNSPTPATPPAPVETPAPPAPVSPTDPAPTA